MKYLPALLFLVACQSKPVSNPKYHDKFWLGCISAYTYWQINSDSVKDKKFGAADKWCTKQDQELKMVEKRRKLVRE